jgi:LacI family gluconate utilization system Gnt-I transcriptional repressor
MHGHGSQAQKPPLGRTPLYPLSQGAPDLAARAITCVPSAIVASGYRNIAFLGTQMDGDFRARRRLEGFEDALHRAGMALADRDCYSCGSALLKGREMRAAVLARSSAVEFLHYSRDMIRAGGLL